MAQLNMNSPELRQLGGGNGVIHMGPLNVIRRMYLRQKLSIREIARRTGLSRNTVTKHLAAEVGGSSPPNRTRFSKGFMRI